MSTDRVGKLLERVAHEAIPGCCSACEDARGCKSAALLTEG